MLILIIFIAEAVIKIMAESPKPWRYFRDAWNVMDFLIACVGLIDMLMSLSGAEAVSSLLSLLFHRHLSIAHRMREREREQSS